MTKLNNRFKSQFTNNTVAVALFNGVNDAIVLPKKTDEVSWQEFINDPVINQHEILPDKSEGTGFTTASFKTLEDEGVETKSGVNNQLVVIRNANNVKRYHALVVDVDGGMTIEEAQERFKENEYFGYTSFNHCTRKIKNDKGEVYFTEFDDTNHKFRLVFLISDAVSPYEIRSRKDTLLSYFDGADKSTFAISRLFYTASCPAYLKPKAQVWHNQGALLDVLSFDEKAQVEVKQSEEYKQFNLAVKEAVKNGLKQIGAVEHDPYYKIAASMSRAGMTFQDFEEVSQYLKPNHVGDIDYLLERWTHSSKLKDISPGYVINLLKQHGFIVHQKKPAKKSTETKLLELEVKSLEQQITTLTETDDEDNSDLLDTLSKQLEEKQDKLKTSETVSVNTFNDDLIDLFERRAIYYVVSEGLIYEYLPSTGAWISYKLQYFLHDEPFITDEQGGVELFHKFMKSQGRVYLSIGLSSKPFVKEERKLNLFRKDHWLQPEEGDYDEVFDILLMSLGGLKEENIRHLKEVIGWKYLRPYDYTLPTVVIYGEGGVGKDLLIKCVLRAIFGQSQVAVVTQDEIASFNGVIAGKMAVLINENTIDKTNMEKMKNLFGSEFINVNEKYQKVYVAENTPLYFIASNEALGAILLSRDSSDRRFSILHVSKSIPVIIGEMKGWDFDTSLRWWLERKHKLSDPVEVAKWLNHVVNIAKELEVTPDKLQGEDYKALMDKQAGPLEWVLHNIFEHEQFEYITVKDAFDVYKLKCEEFGLYRNFALGKFRANVNDYLERKLKRVIHAPKQSVLHKETGIDTKNSVWKLRDLDGTLDLRKVSYVYEVDGKKHLVEEFFPDALQMLVDEIRGGDGVITH